MADIRNLEELLKISILGESKLTGYKITRLTAPGENYGSLMLSVEVKTKNKNGSEETKLIVAKQIPENDWLRKLFKVHITFKKEMEFYNTLVPTLQQFQKENGINDVMDFFPNYYGGRVNLQKDSDEVDEDAVILLENLKLSGYITVERTAGFDLETAKLVLNDLAVLHAVPLALKLTKPDVFKAKIRPHLQIIPLFDDVEEETELARRQQNVNLTKQNPETAHLADRVERSLRVGEEIYAHPNQTPREPFATLRHNDYWGNNTMLKFSNGKAIKNKMIDFQVIDYGSPASDLVFFIYSSIQIPVIAKHYDELVKLYYDRFINTLEELKCSTKDFSFEAFQNEIDNEARDTEFCHLIGMLGLIFAEKSDVKELKDYSESDFGSNGITDKYKQRAWFITKEFAKRNWI